MVRGRSSSYAGASSVSKSGDVGSTSSEYRWRSAVSTGGWGCSRAWSAASATSRSTSASRASSSSAVAIPVSRRRARVRFSGSRASWAANSSSVRYIRSSSDMEWE